MKTPLPAQAKRLHQALTHLVQKYQFRDRNDICCYGISVSQCHTLEALGEHGTQTMHALAEHLPPGGKHGHPRGGPARRKGAC